MAEGFLTRWYGKLIKAPFVLRRQMRNRDRVIVKSLRLFKNKMSEIESLIREKHRVTRAGKQQLKLVKGAKTLEKSETDLGFYEEVEETLTLDEIIEIFGIILTHEEKQGATGYERQFAEGLLKFFEVEESQERSTYFTYLEPIIKAAERKGNHQAIMELIKSLGTTQTNLFAVLAMRLDIRTASKGISRLRTDKKALPNALAQWDKAINKRSAEPAVKYAFENISQEIQATLHSDALIAKRDFLLVILTLKYLHDEESEMGAFVREHLMPRLMEEENLNELEEVEKKFAEDMHMLSQGMRRIFALEHKAEELAKRVAAESTLKKKAA